MAAGVQTRTTEELTDADLSRLTSDPVWGQHIPTTVRSGISEHPRPPVHKYIAQKERGM